MRPEVEEELVEFLRAQKEADVGTALRHITDWTQAHSKEDADRHGEILGTLKGHSLRIGSLEKADEKLEKRVEQSGSWDLEQAQAATIMAQKNAQWWRDKLTTVLVGIVMLLLGGACTALFDAFHK